MAPRARTRKRDAVLGDVPADIDDDTRLALLAQELVRQQLASVSEMAYEDYCLDLLGMELTPGQAAVTRVLFDGEAPDPEYADLFGGMTEAPPKDARRVAAAILGRGGGKSRVLLAARALHLALVAHLHTMGVNDPPALVAIVAPDQRQSRSTLSFIRGFLEDRPLLKHALKAEALAETIRITRPDGKRVNIEARPAAAGGNSVRGPVLAGVLLEESAFFEGEGYEVNDVAIFDAAVPRLDPAGQIVLASSPWAQAGKLWELYRDNFGKPESAVVCKAPSLRIRPDEMVRAAYEAELKNNPDNAKREYDAEFLSADAELFFPEAVIQKCIDPTLLVPGTVARGERVRFGGDFAFISDSSALVGFVERGALLPCIEIDEQRPKPGMPLVPSAVVARFAARMQSFGARLLVADDHYREAIQEHLTSHGIALAGVGVVPAHAYVLARTLMAQGRVRIPAYPRLLAQLRRVRGTMKPGGVITIHQPRDKDLAHGDLVSALVCALSGVTLTVELPAPEMTPEEKYNKLAKEDQARRLRANEKAMAKRDRPLEQWAKKRVGAKMWEQFKRMARS